MKRHKFHLPRSVKRRNKSKDGRASLPTYEWHRSRFHLTRYGSIQVPLHSRSREGRNCPGLHRKVVENGLMCFDTSYWQRRSVSLDSPFVQSFVTELPSPGKFLEMHHPILGLLILAHGDRVIEVQYSSLVEDVIKCVLKGSDISVSNEKWDSGSIDIYGPTALYMLSAVLRPVSKRLDRLWPQLANSSMHQIPQNTRLRLAVYIERNRTRSSGTGLQRLLHEAEKEYGRVLEPSLNCEPLTVSRVPVDVEILFFRNGFIRINLPRLSVVPLWTILAQFPLLMGGLREMHRLYLATKTPFYPNDYVFSPLGLDLWLRDIESKENIHQLHPISSKNLQRHVFNSQFCVIRVLNGIPRRGNEIIISESSEVIGVVTTGCFNKVSASSEGIGVLFRSFTGDCRIRDAESAKTRPAEITEIDLLSYKLRSDKNENEHKI